ncbi:methyltransferase [Alkanindiges sp. WGS2144]|uniref:methyltransferase n=1 Tax=Alkanindiges sp. WGS2144 TaxID=3366808 RepID=UPI0037520664
MDPRSEVVLRQTDYIQGSVLLVGCAADNLMNQLQQSESVTSVQAWTWLFDDYQQLLARHPAQCHFGITPPAQHLRQVIIFLPKSKELTNYLLHQAASHLEPNGQIFLVGEKRAGIERAAKQLQQFGKTIKLDSARHCQLWQCSQVQKPATRALNDWTNQYQVSFAQHTQSIHVISLPGVFSHGRLDQGSALLIEHLDGLPTGDLLDFGCGAGLIGTILKKKYPAQTVHFLDVDAFALESTRLTLQANQIALDDSVQLIAGRGIADAPQQLAAIISNPPFHQGIHTHYQASEDLLQHSHAHLKTSGELRIVANSFLKYPPLIERQFDHCHSLAQRHGFHVYQARRS